jgi:type IX secretion system PorP/SprF family membrane protein
MWNFIKVKIDMKINLKILVGFSLFFFLSYINAVAQTESMYSQYMFNTININPAYAGSRSVPSLNTLFRKQWVGIQGSPQTTSISFDMPLNNYKVGLGIQLLDDRLGVEKTTSLQFNYSYRVNINEKGILAMGIRAGFINYRADYLDVMTITKNDPVFSQNVSGLLPAAGVGMYYMTDKFYAGLSVPSLLQTKVNVNRENNELSRLNNLHFFATMGYVLPLSEQIKLKPSLLVKSVSGAPIQLDVNTNIWLRDKIALGVSYRTGDAVVGLVEFQLNNLLRFGYAYDITTSKLKLHNQGSHEIMLRYEFGSVRTSNMSPRYF